MIKPNLNLTAVIVVFSLSFSFSQNSSLEKGVVKVKSLFQDSPFHKDDFSYQYGTGFCFYINYEQKNIYVLTAYHVISRKDDQSKDNADSLEIQFSGESRIYGAKIYTYVEDLSQDLAVLQITVDSIPDNIKVLKLTTSKNVSRGEDIYMIGFDGNRDYTISKGSVSKKETYDIEFSGFKPEKGNSGSPLLRFETNEVVGIIIQRNQSRNNQSARKIDLAVDYLISDNPIFRNIKDYYDPLLEKGSHITRPFNLKNN